MAYTLTNEERETILNFNEAEGTAKVSTFNGVLIRKLAELGKSRPSECSGHGPNEIGEAVYTIPKRWIKINAPQIMSELALEQRRSAIASMRKNAPLTPGNPEEPEEDF